MHKLDTNNTLLLVIDIQERLIGAMDKTIYNIAKENVIRLVKSANILNLPVFATQQYTKGLGNTIPEISNLIDTPHIEKLTFSCWDESSFKDKLKKMDINNIIVTGMETHICVLQTVIDLLESGYNVHVVNDAVASREKFNLQVGIDYMRDAGAKITVTETVLFQLLKKSGSPEFKEISKLIK